MKTVSSEEFKKLYGETAVTQFSTPTPAKTSPLKELPGKLAQRYKEGISGVKQAVSNVATGKTSLGTGVQRVASRSVGAAGRGVGDVIGAGVSALAPDALEEKVGQAISPISQPIMERFNKLKETNPELAKDIEDALGMSELLGAGAVTRPVKQVAQAGARTAVNATESAVRVAGKTGTYAKGVADDVIPTTDRVINHQITKALDLSPGDLDKISRSTGNNVGPWLAENNLISTNKELTQKGIKDFYQKNYDEVRAEIKKADEGEIVYFREASSIPGYQQALGELNKKTQSVPGLEDVNTEIKTLLEKPNPTLSDVQRTKELLDDHFSLYKATGDVSEGVAKQGLAKIRQEIKEYIETEVKKATGADIKKLNNNVTTSRNINEAITTRAPKGLTASNIKMGDLGIFGVGFAMGGGPLTGLALLFGKKLLETPTVRLRIAKYLDSVSDAKKVRIKDELAKGKIPKELDKFVTYRKKTQARPPE